MKARRSLLAALLTAGAVAASGCSSETTSSSSTGDAGVRTVALDATMSIVSPEDGACFPLPPSPDPTIPITLVFRKADLTPANVYLRPAGACSSIIGYVCGHIVVKVLTGSSGAGGAGGTDSGEVEPVNNQGATSTVNVLLRKFSDPYQDFKIEVALVDDNGSELLVAKPTQAGTADLDAGVPLRVSLEVKVRASCGATGDAGADGG
jgi:hypothetical protein